ncbi:hypothetical protein [Caballeronia sp. KNU42]
MISILRRRNPCGIAEIQSYYEDTSENEPVRADGLLRVTMIGVGQSTAFRHTISAALQRDYLEREARWCLSQTRPNNTTLIAVRMAPATIQMGVSAGKKSPLLSRMKAQAPASSISPQNPVATAGSMPLDPVGSFRGKAGTGSRLNGAGFLCGLSAGCSSGMA